MVFIVFISDIFRFSHSKKGDPRNQRVPPSKNTIGNFLVAVNPPIRGDASHLLLTGLPQESIYLSRWASFSEKASKG